jgi:Fe-S-cluster-containing dehydrogenase component
MSRYGLLIHYEFCSGCHSCELACKQEHALPVGKFGIKVSVSGPMKMDDDRWSFDNIPIPTDMCDLCFERVNKGKQPACVHHCQAGVMKFGMVDELVKFMELQDKTALFTPRPYKAAPSETNNPSSGDGEVLR